MAKTLKITVVKSPVDSPATRGAIKKVSHLLKVEEV